MTIINAEIVTWTKYISRNNGRKQTTMLLIVSTEKYKTDTYTEE